MLRSSREIKYKDWIADGSFLLYYLGLGASAQKVPVLPVPVIPVIPGYSRKGRTLGAVPFGTFYQKPEIYRRAHAQPM